MNSDSNVNKFFIIQMIVLNIIVIFLIIREIINLNEIRKAEQFIISNQNIENTEVSDANLEFLNKKYQEILNNNSSQNSLGDLIKFIEIKTETYSLQIKDSKVISATDNEIIYDFSVEGDIKNIAGFIYEIEEDRSIKEISQTSMNIVNNIPNVKIIIVNKKI